MIVYQQIDRIGQHPDLRHRKVFRRKPSGGNLVAKGSNREPSEQTATFFAYNTLN